jgi:hypothetical protein
MVMELWAKASRRVRARAVLSPKTPEPMMRIEEGGEKGGDEEEEEEEAAAAIWERHGSQKFRN